MFRSPNNLQIWNEEISPRRRYVLIRVNETQVVTRVRVVNGETIARYDKTGTLTQKYQAKSRKPVKRSCLAVDCDTSPVLREMRKMTGLFSIRELFQKLVQLTGTSIANPGVDQERNRGAALHRAVCHCLGGVTTRIMGNSRTCQTNSSKSNSKRHRPLISV